MKTLKQLLELHGKGSLERIRKYHAGRSAEHAFHAGDRIDDPTHDDTAAHYAHDANAGRARALAGQRDAKTTGDRANAKANARRAKADAKYRAPDRRD